MLQAVKDELSLRRKLLILEITAQLVKVKKSCAEFGIPRSSYYYWKKKFIEGGREGLIRKRPIALSHPKQLPQKVVDQILEIRKSYHFGPQRIAWYMERYHGVPTSCSTVYRTLVRNGLSCLPKSTPRRAIHTKRYSKSVPGHHVQVDVKFIWLKKPDGTKVRRFQYTAIDDATRIRAMKIYQRHTQKNAIVFVDYIIVKFPFRIHTIRTDRGHEFQALFHWHVEDLGIRHVYIKPRSPQLNGKVERSHRTDREEFYQLLTYTDDVDLNKKLTEWENFYNFHRPHGAFDGKTPYEALNDSLQKSTDLSNRI
jgi:transposase InsO family protein